MSMPEFYYEGKNGVKLNAGFWQNKAGWETRHLD
jgi:hypothetical protein